MRLYDAQHESWKKMWARAWILEECCPLKQFTVYYRAAIVVMWGDACPFNRETLFCQQCRDSAMVWRENPSDLLNLISACSWGTSNVDKGVSVYCASSYNRFLWAALLLAVNRTERDIFARLQILFEIQMRGYMQMHVMGVALFHFLVYVDVKEICNIRWSTYFISEFSG